MAGIALRPRSRASLPRSTCLDNPAITLTNVIFQTVTAAQRGRLREVEADYRSGRIMDRSYSYGFNHLGALSKGFGRADAAKDAQLFRSN